MAHYLKFIGPNAAEPLIATFLVWVMLIVGGSGNNRGAILGALLIWMIWSATEILTNRLPDDLAIRTAYIRVFLIGLMLQIVLQRFPSGILPERRTSRRPAARATVEARRARRCGGAALVITHPLRHLWTAGIGKRPAPAPNGRSTSGGPAIMLAQGAGARRRLAERRRHGGDRPVRAKAR